MTLGTVTKSIAIVPTVWLRTNVPHVCDGGRGGLLPDAALLGGFTAIMAVTGIMMLRPRREEARVTPAPAARTALVGVLVGALTGVVGAGGGFVVVPALAMLCGLPIAEAIATSLLVIAMNSFAGFAGYIGHVEVDARVAAVVTGAAIVGALGGALVASRIRPESLRRGFAIFVLGMAALMALRQIPASFRAAVASDPRLTHVAAALLGAGAVFVAARLRRRVASDA